MQDANAAPADGPSREDSTPPTEGMAAAYTAGRGPICFSLSTSIAIGYPSEDLSNFPSIWYGLPSSTARRANTLKVSGRSTPLMPSGRAYHEPSTKNTVPNRFPDCASVPVSSIAYLSVKTGIACRLLGCCRIGNSSFRLASTSISLSKWMSSICVRTTLEISIAFAPIRFPLFARSRSKSTKCLLSPQDVAPSESDMSRRYYLKRSGLDLDDSG